MRIPFECGGAKKKKGSTEKVQQTKEEDGGLGKKNGAEQKK